MEKHPGEDVREFQNFRLEREEKRGGEREEKGASPHVCQS
jgi:hypothetical protein